MSARSPYGRKWAKKRAAHLKVEPLCRLCSQAGRLTPATVADHIEPHRNDPFKFWHGPLQSLCETCHNAIKQAQEKSGHLRGCGVDGLPLDTAHHWYGGGGIESLAEHQRKPPPNGPRAKSREIYGA